MPKSVPACFRREMPQGLIGEADLASSTTPSSRRGPPPSPLGSAESGGGIDQPFAAAQRNELAWFTSPLPSQRATWGQGQRGRVVFTPLAGTSSTYLVATTASGALPFSTHTRSASNRLRSAPRRRRGVEQVAEGVRARAEAAMEHAGRHVEPVEGAGVAHLRRHRLRSTRSSGAAAARRRPSRGSGSACRRRRGRRRGRRCRRPSARRRRRRGRDRWRSRSPGSARPDCRRRSWRNSPGRTSPRAPCRAGPLRDSRASRRRRPPPPRPARNRSKAARPCADPSALRRPCAAHRPGAPSGRRRSRRPCTGSPPGRSGTEAARRPRRRRRRRACRSSPARPAGQPAAWQRDVGPVVAVQRLGVPGEVQSSAATSSGRARRPGCRRSPSG